MKNTFYIGKIELDIANNRYHLQQSPPLYANVLIEQDSLKVLTTDQGGGIHNGEVQNITLNLNDNSSVLWQPAAATIFYPSYDNNKFNSNNESCQINQIISLNNSKLDYQGKPNVLCKNSRSLFNTNIELDNESELNYIEFFSTGRIAHGEKWQFSSLAMEMQLYKNGKLKFLERWQVNNGGAKCTIKKEIFSSPPPQGIAGFHNCDLFCTGLFSGKNAKREVDKTISQLEQNSSNENTQQYFSVEIEPELYLLRGLI